MPLAAKLWLAGLAGMIALTVGALVLARYGFNSTVEMGSIEGLERLADIELPEGAVLVNARYSAPAFSQGCHVWAVLRMSPQQAEDLLSAPPFEEMSSEDRRLRDSGGSYVREIAEQWYPDDAERFLSAVTAYRSDYRWWTTALADLDDPTSAVVYVYVELI